MLDWRFKNLKTSTQISIKFTLFTISLVLIFGLVANIVFFKNWYNREYIKVTIWPTSQIWNMWIKVVLWRNRLADTEIFDINSNEAKIIINSKRRNQISKIEDYYFMYNIKGNKIYTTNITQHINAQKNLIFISIYLTLIFWIISYILSIFFVENSLKKLNQLLKFLDKLDIDNLDQKIQISWHPMDEINRLSCKFNETLEKINHQTLSLKDFVSNASHELKTPLMSISSEIDYAKKSKKYVDSLDNIKKNIKNIDNILQTLITITKIQSVQNLEKKNIDISKETIEIINTLIKIYQNKKISLDFDIKDKIIKPIHLQSRNIIIKNLIDNAFKFTNPQGNISIKIDDNKLQIKDNWIWIDHKDLPLVRDRFWQADRSKTDTKSFGLWLYIVRLLVQKHWRNIDIKSKINKGSTVTIYFW